MTAPYPLEAWAMPDKDVFEFWISFFPTAPVFGVEWRFAGMMVPAASPFLASAAPFAAAFPGTRAAAARPGEFDSPARAGDGLDRPIEKATAAAASATTDAGRIAADAGTAAARMTAGLAKAGRGKDGAEASEARPGTDGAGDETPQATPTARAADEAPAPGASEPADSTDADSSEPALLLSDRPDDPDDLKTLKGIGPGVASQLNELGVWKFDQIARMSEADLAWIDERLNAIKGRCFRDDWIGQAKRLVQ